VRIVVVGASGRTGRLFVTDALAAGHEVVALVRDSSRLGVPASDRLTVVEGDVLEGADPLSRAIAGCDAVVSLLAPRHERDERIYSLGTAAIVAAMEAAGVRRLFAVSAEGVRVARRELPLGYRAVLLLPGLDEIYDDIGVMEDEIEASGLEWTIVRPAVLRDGARAPAVRSVPGATVPGGLLVSRADLSAFMLECVERDLYRCERVALAE
jgi:putative NADH-flavin reductase